MPFTNVYENNNRRTFKKTLFQIQAKLLKTQ